MEDQLGPANSTYQTAVWLMLDWTLLQNYVYIIAQKEEEKEVTTQVVSRQQVAVVTR